MRKQARSLVAFLSYVGTCEILKYFFLGKYIILPKHKVCFYRSVGDCNLNLVLAV